nr:DUF4279 domain-containing protein [Actinoplanes consettensis]
MAFDPGDVTLMVGLQPTDSWQRGDRHPSRPEPRRFSSWQYGLPKVRTFCTEDGSIHVSIAAITYTAETVKRLARLNASVDHDQYVYLPD